MPGTKHHAGQDDRLRQLAVDEGSAETLADFGAARTFGKRADRGRDRWVAVRHVRCDGELVREFLGEADGAGHRSWGPAQRRDTFTGRVTAEGVIALVGEGVAVREGPALAGVRGGES